MEWTQYASVGLSALSFLGGLISYILGLRIKNEIAENNEKINKEIDAAKAASVQAVNSLRTELAREFGATWGKIETDLKETQKEVQEFEASFSEKILSTVNGKYVRTDLHQQSLSNIQERFVSLKELIEVNMNKIEQGLDRQILDLKDRIFHSGQGRKGE